MRLAFFHGLLGHPSEAEAWRRLLGHVDVIGPPLGLAESWQAEVDRLAEDVRCCHALMGYSMGARLALAVAIERPNAVQSLVLISGSPGLVSEADRRARRNSDAAWRRRLLKGPIDRFLRDWYRQPVFAGDPDDCLDRLRDDRRHLDRPYQARLLALLSVAEQPDYRPRLHELQIPVLFLAGSRDTKYVELAREMCEQVSHGEQQTIAGGGHVIHRSHPTDCVNAIQTFLKYPTQNASYPR